MRVSSVKIENFRPHVKNSLFGFVDVTLSSGLTICGVTLHRKINLLSLSPPYRKS
jgi:hypothetical protein